MLRKPETLRSEKYKAFVRGLPCCVCGTMENVEAAHTEGSGMGIKGPDTRTIPMCSYHHNEGWHHLGRDTFCELYNIDWQEEVIKCLEQYVMGM